MPRRKGLQRVGEGLFVEIGPQKIEEQKLSISRLPQQEIGEADLTRRPDQQIELGQIGGLQLARDGGFVNRCGLNLAGGDSRRELARGSRYLRSRPVIQSDDER